MKLHRSASLICLALVTIAVLLAQRDSMPTRPVAPFTIVTKELHVFHGDSATAVETHTLYAIRSDGAATYRSLPTGKNHSPFDARNVFLPAERRKVYIYEKIGMKSTHYLREEAPARARVTSADAQCRTSHDAQPSGAEMIFGLRAIRFESTSSESGSVLVRDIVWYAPELNCREVKRTVETTAAGKLLSRLDHETLSIIKGEPDAALFVVPPDLREVRPSEAAKAITQEKTGRPYSAEDQQKCLLKGYDIMDKNYFESQGFRPGNQ